MVDLSIDQILAGPDYFICLRLTTRLPKSICIQRQTQRVAVAPISLPVYLCQDCARGAEIAREKGVIVPQKKPPVICAADGCEEQARVRGLCPNHYSKWSAGYLPEMGPYIRVRRPKEEIRPL